jgi:phosphoribosyl 1,2-cyclic phosphodiesterase
MRAISLQSGSNGNCVYVEGGGASVLIDAGISGKQAEDRLAGFGVDIRTVGAVILTHDHRDHCRCAGVFHRKFHLPIVTTPRTLQAATRALSLGDLGEVRTFHAGDTLAVGDLRVQTISTPHDGADGVAVVLADDSHRLGVLTDLGHVFNGLADVVASLDAVVLESNYDPEMLRRGPYPEFLQERIRGPGGHLSNAESAGLLAAAGGNLRWACLAHLSEHNNDPRLALRTHRRIVGERLPLWVASRHEPVGVLEL